jgi:hypothetical protein
VDSMVCPNVCQGAGVCGGICRPATRQCSGKTVQTCNTTGTAWTNGTVCPFVCTAGACAGICVPGARRCNPAALNTPQVCNAAGQWANDAAGACPAVCFGAGLCGDCTPTTRRCGPANQPQLCDAMGHWGNSGMACNFVCTNGACGGECVPGTVGCNGNVPRTCGPTGTWQNGTPCATAALCNPLTATCTPPTCAPGDSRCNADNSAVETCSADRTMFEETMPCLPPTSCVATGNTAACVRPGPGTP